ncbi:AhpC/TSA family protein [Pseudobutyrivibrio sp. OR37]|uniref:TlpA family protein disulfide reductase n=1 Tax=Pseudobutyrivibrio sp. OR37 TaxID=1798186 RepID=UPI0008E3520F|nr:TlpA disulfide reductase family protein [Pseudobutyrivibrio sp. OR37]SFH68399.1 AhpC/TSA family protein [Pseudobutyrivibrio sp. OR37]
MNRLFRTLCVIGFTGAMFVACGQTSVKTSEDLSSESIAELETVENGRFSTIDNEGNAVSDSIFSDYDVTIVNYWAVYCPYCIEEMPNLEEYASQLGDNIQLIGAVSIQDKDEGIRAILTEEDTATKAKSIMDENSATYKNVISNESFKDFILRCRAIL